MNKLIKRNNKGRVSYNVITEEYIIDFGNIYITLDFYQFKEFEEIIETLEVKNNHSNADNRIRIPFDSDNLSIVLKPEELLDLKDLLGLEQNMEQMKLKLSFSMN